MSEQQQKQFGFTIIEVIATIFVAAIFIGAIFQIFIVQSQLTSSIVAYNNADSLAYNNLRQYAYGGQPKWFVCQYPGGNTSQPAIAQSLPVTNATTGIPGPVAQEVIATAPYGCGGGQSGMGYPIKVVSTVTYGLDARKVSHATYVSY